MPTVIDETVCTDENSLKKCTKCETEKQIGEFYSQKKHSKKRGEYIYYQPYCKECASEKSQKWLYENLDRKRKIAQKYYHSDKGRQNKLRDRERQKENNYAYSKQYQKENLEKFRLYRQKRRSIKNTISNDFTLEDWQYCLEYFNNSCAYCGLTNEAHYKKFDTSLHQEHILPVTKGGSYSKENIVPACKSCNSSKNDKELINWLKQQTFYSLEKEEKVFFYLSSIKKENMEVS
ncbi:HNH endonuclease [Bacillus infantis]|uniref:HNH endonuclease n=1 Tax=Bacillus infantis TaxID=324767 RepID=UPI003CF77652